MSNVITFTPRKHPPEPAAPAPLAGLTLRAHLEDAAQTALDAADKTTGSLPSDPRSLFMPGEHPAMTDTDPPEASWQNEARESSEERQRDFLECEAN